MAQQSPIGLIPKPNTISVAGLTESINWNELFSMPKSFWEEEVEDLEKYFSEQFGNDLPNAITEELHKLKERVQKM